IGTNLMFFEKGTPTKDIWFWGHRVPEGQKARSMTKPIRFEHLQGCIDWWTPPFNELISNHWPQAGRAAKGSGLPACFTARVLWARNSMLVADGPYSLDRPPGLSRSATPIGCLDHIT